jgi:TIR domain-containing protein
MAGVFISYSAKDRAFVQRLYEALRAADIPTWLDLEGIAPSKSWDVEVRSAIEAADAFLFVLSPDLDVPLRTVANIGC